MNGLSHLLLLQSRALQAEDLAQLSFVLVNDTRQLVSYDSALFFHYQPGHKPKTGTIKAISDVAGFDARSAYVVAQTELCRACLDLCAGESRIIQLSDLQLPDNKNNKAVVAGQPHLLWLSLSVSLKHKEGASSYPVGGLLLMRKEAWRDQELRVLMHWQEGINHALVNLYAQSRLTSRLWYNQRRRKVFLALLVLVPLALCIPVPLSVVAPAEIIPLEPEIIRAPIGGAIATLHVVPNEQVVSGQLLISLDDRELQTQLQVVEQAKVIAQAELNQAQQSALFDVKAKAALPLLSMRLEQQQAEYDYTALLLARSEIRASSNGVVIVNNENEMIGRPVVLGERLLTLAQLDRKELQLWLPVHDEIPLQEGDRVVFYPETAPDANVEAVIHRIAYQADETPDAGLAYRLLATIESSDSAKQLRIGMRGSGRIFNEKVSLFYYLFHKPLSKLRLWFGV
ncbi:MAG: HlyD family efflux transporter periplasmic adaptor subunit [Olleya sp.]